MQIFIESTDMKLWVIVKNGPCFIPKIKNDKGEFIDKLKLGKAHQEFKS